MASQQHVLQTLTEAYEQKKLAGEIKVGMLPALAEALTPHLSRYEVKYSSFPDLKTMLVIVANFLQDGFRVQTLADEDSPKSIEAWNQLRDYLLNITQKHWPGIGSDYQEEIVSRTLIRVQRYLTRFLFLSQFSTWVYTIWQNECWRLANKIKEEQAKEVSLNQEDGQGQILGDTLPSSGPSPEDSVERNQVVVDFWQRLAKLETEQNIRILKLHLSDYTLMEIQQALGPNAPSLATIKRHKDGVIERLKSDQLIKNIAMRMGILPDDHYNNYEDAKEVGSQWSKSSER